MLVNGLMSCRISANVIALNEQERLPACLDSLRWADEIVVVDGGSQDRTTAIAHRFTDQVFIRPFDDYATQRNRALEQSRGQWIFSIDADERVPEALAQEIRMAAESPGKRWVGFRVPIRSRIFGRRFRYSGTQGERKLRLFRKDFAQWQGPVHETVTLEGPVGTLQNAIEHDSSPDLETYLRKLNHYSSLEAGRLCQAGSAPSRWKQWLMPPVTFAKMYVAQLGALDGPEGFRFCALSALATWCVYQKAWEQQQRQEDTRFFRNNSASGTDLVGVYGSSTKAQ